MRSAVARAFKELNPMPEKRPICLQLYTVRDETARDFAETIAHVAKIGYAGVELAGYGSAQTALAAKQILDDNNLFACGAHVPLEAMEKDLGKVVEEAQILGYEYVSVPYLGENRRQGLGAYQDLGQELNTIGQTLKDAGIQLCYHNHDFEFDTFGGDTFAFDALFASANPDLLMVEMDTFWVKKAGQDPAAYVRKYKNRIPLVHLKDMTPEGQFAEVGEGTVDYNALLAACEASGVRFYIVEQDKTFNHAPLESIQISFDNLKKMGVA